MENVENEFDILFKAVVIGDESVGKSSILHRFCDDDFDPTSKATLGIDFKITRIVLKNKRVAKVQIWDTAGQERFRAIQKSYFNGAHAIIVVFDITKEKTFQHIDDWIVQSGWKYDKVKKDWPPLPCMFLVGNKCDLKDERVVKSELGEKLAKHEGFSKYIETSAKTGENVKELFNEMAEEIYKNDKPLVDNKEGVVDIDGLTGGLARFHSFQDDHYIRSTERRCWC